MSNYKESYYKEGYYLHRYWGLKKYGFFNRLFRRREWKPIVVYVWFTPTTTEQRGPMTIEHCGRIHHDPSKDPEGKYMWFSDLQLSQAKYLGNHEEYLKKGFKFMVDQNKLQFK